jgi:hypothetical protein
MRQLFVTFLLILEDILGSRFNQSIAGVGNIIIDKVPNVSSSWVLLFFHDVSHQSGGA